MYSSAVLPLPIIPLVGLEGVFGAVTLRQDETPLSEKVRRRLAEKNGHRRRAD